MPWYKVSISYGPGHMGESISYVFERGPLLNKGEREALIENSCHWDWDYPIGKVRIIKKLPKDVLADKIKDYRYSVEHSRDMIKILKSTPVLKERGKIPL